MRKLLFLIIFLVIGIGLYFYFEKKELAQEPVLVQKPIIYPTEINQNFLNQVNKCFIPIAAVYGYTLRITDAFRSLTEQDKIFNQGRTEDGSIVSWAPPGKSIHNYGYAVDVVDRWHGYNINWVKLAKIGEYCGLTQVDDPHFEYRGGLTTAQFEAGMTPPPLTLPCALMESNKKLTKSDLKS